MIQSKKRKKVVTKPKTPTPFSVVVKYLAVFDGRSCQAGAITRSNELLTRILGNDASLATLANDAPDGEIYFDLDDMQLHFIEGATAEDDHYRISFLSIPAGVGVRTSEGLGYALTTILERLRIQGEYIATDMPA
jgi:hypothetical protein